MLNYKNHIGIDFSHTNTKIYLHNKGVIYDEPTLMYFPIEVDKIIIGNQAKQDALEDTNINLINPLKDALFIDLVKYCVEVVKKVKRKFYTRNIIIFSFPFDLNDEEEILITKAIKTKRKDKVLFLEPTILEALGNNIDISSSSKSFIVNFNETNSVAAIISNNTINIREKLTVDGRYLDFSILKYVKMHYDIDISLDEAKKVRNDVADLSDRVNKKISINDTEIKSSEIRPILKDNIDRLCLDLLALIDIFSQPTFDAIKDKGIYLIGDSASILSLAPYIENKLRMPVNLCQNFNNGLIDGMVQLFKNLK